MDFKFTDLEIPDDSPEARVIEEIMERDNVSAYEALRSALRNSSSTLNSRLSPRAPLRTDDAESVIGLFADSPEAVDSILEVVADRAHRYGMDES